eukprot:3095821-Heterocapsa_arctica.AAC.1
MPSNCVGGGGCRFSWGSASSRTRTHQGQVACGRVPSSHCRAMAALIALLPRLSWAIWRIPMSAGISHAWLVPA